MNSSYDKQHGMLAITGQLQENEEFETNMIAGDVVLDIATSGRVFGIEILDTKRFLSQFISAQEVGELLDNFTQATFEVQPGTEGFSLVITFYTKTQSFPAHIAVPVSV